MNDLKNPGHEVMNSCSIQLSMKFSLLTNMKMPTICGIFIFISTEISMLSYVSKKEFAVVSNLRTAELSITKVLQPRGLGQCTCRPWRREGSTVQKPKLYS